jgi:hypothetical protein
VMAQTMYAHMNKLIKKKTWDNNLQISAYGETDNDGIDCNNGMTNSHWVAVCLCICSLPPTPAPVASGVH